MNFIAGKKPENVKVIVSSHNYQYTPSVEEISELVVTIQSSGADIVKIATNAVDITDVARMFQVIVHCQVSNYVPNQFSTRKFSFENFHICIYILYTFKCRCTRTYTYTYTYTHSHGGGREG